eukprot:TRINITY_DN20561_c0_g1_i1.p1 TRINITY_DN20561_c0_g1~~TRINITY_DN20561_c0_g1_i1.p1  ORF type:complete len:530 (-),score=136.55 TRINITY_DN20561_c0_g1_i1:306-1895(-)
MASGSQGPGPWGRLVPFNGNSTMYFCYDHEEKITIGRSTANTIQLKSSVVSAQHCTISRDNAVPPITWLDDQGRNGTFVNGRKVGAGNRQALVDGDVVSFAHPLRKDMVAPDDFVGYFYHALADRTEGYGEILKHYHFLAELGAGTFATVKCAVHNKTGDRVAVKVVNKEKHGDEKSRAALKREVRILQSLQHPNITAIKDVFENDKYLFMVLELCTGGDLFDSVSKRGCFTEAEARDVVRQVLRALEYLHQRGIAHRDLKPENLLFADMSPGSCVKLTDFGLAQISRGPMKTMCGTPQYVAPEVLLGSSGSSGYGVQVDMWALGVITYVLLSGGLPFSEDRTDRGLYSQIQLGAFSFEPEEDWVEVSLEAKDFINRLIEVRPHKRMDVRTALKHTWMNVAASRIGCKLKSTMHLRSLAELKCSPIPVLQEVEQANWRAGRAVSSSPDHVAEVANEHPHPDWTTSGTAVEEQPCAGDSPSSVSSTTSRKRGRTSSDEEAAGVEGADPLTDSEEHESKRRRRNDVASAPL